MAVLGDDHLDAIAFTGGIGENSAHVRELALSHLKLFGIKLDQERNLAARFGKSGVITADDSAFKAIVLPTNEELVIAQDTARFSGLINFSYKPAEKSARFFHSLKGISK